MEMERCLEEISSTLLDAGEPISYRTIGIRSQVSTAASVDALSHFLKENKSIKALQLLIKRAAISDDGKSETAAAKRDPRARTLSLSVSSHRKTEDVLYQQIYALYNKPNATSENVDEAEAIAVACWAQERQARNDVFDAVSKHAPQSASVKALYASEIKCANATTRQDFGEEQGEETVSAFDAINASAKKKPSSSSSSSPFFKSSSKTGFSSTSSSRKNEGSKMTSSKKQEPKKIDMSNVLTVDSDDEEDDETDAPIFVKKTTNKRIISDDEDEADEVPPPKETSTSVPRSRNVKRRLNASPAEIKKTKQTKESNEESNEECFSKTEQRAELDDEADDDSVEVPAVDTKRRVLVSKTRINEQGYMVTEKTYEEVELTSEEIEKEQQAAKKKAEEKKTKAAAENAAKAKKETKKHSGPAKQRDLRSFFTTK